jgi:hypothetical protein
VERESSLEERERKDAEKAEEIRARQERLGHVPPRSEEEGREEEREGVKEEENQQVGEALPPSEIPEGEPPQPEPQYTGGAIPQPEPREETT